MSGHDLQKFFQKGAWPRSCAPLNFWVLNANSCKTVKPTDFKFGTRVPRVSLDTTPKKFTQKGAWPGSRDTLNFWALNANGSKTAKATDLKFDTCVPRYSSDLTPKKIIPKGGVFNNLLGGDMHSHKRLLVRFNLFQ